MRLSSLVSRYVAGLLITVCGYVIYAQLVAPRIEGDTGIRLAPPMTPIEPHDFRDDLSGLLPPDGWEWQPCTILQTKLGKILFEDNQVFEDGSVELKPLTLIMYPKVTTSTGQANQRVQPIVMRAPQGARLKFENELAVGADLGELQAGRLEGEVKIYRPASVADPGESFSIVTRNVELTPERISTKHEVAFRFGESYGRGKNLVVDLSSDSNVRSTFSGIDRIEMAKVYEMYLHRKPKAETLEPPASTNDGDLLGDTRRSLFVTTQGPFVFDFNSRSATFNKQVVVRSADAFNDQLQCDELIVLFEPSNDRESPDPDHQKRIDLTRLVARGTPAVITSAEKNARVMANTISYDLTSKSVLLQSDREVSLTRGQQSIVAKEIRYSFTENGRLGTAVMHGPGQLHQVGKASGEKPNVMTCRWQSKLLLQDDQGKKAITLDGAEVSLNDMTLTSEELHLWMWEIPERSENGKQRWRMSPHKMLAEGRVKISSESITGNCSLAAAFWPSPTQSSLGDAHHYPRIATRYPPHRQQPAQHQETLQWTSRQRSGSDQQWRSSSNPAGNVKQVAHLQDLETSNSATQSQGLSWAQPLDKPPRESQHVKFIGREVQLQMSDGDNFGTVKEITVDGDVVVQQIDKSKPADQQTSLEIRGQKLNIETESEDAHRVYVTGSIASPAVVAAPGLELKGQNIHLDQLRNRLWIDGPGEMQMDGSASDADHDPTQTQKDDPKKIALASGGPTAVTWQGGMVFDGIQIYFETDVRSVTKQLNVEDDSTTITQTASTALSLTLNKRIEFNQSRDQIEAGKTEIETLVMVATLDRGEVAFPNSFHDSKSRQIEVASTKFDPRGNTLGTQQIMARRASFDMKTGQANCQGPGVLTIRQPAGNEANSTTPAFTVSSQRGKRRGGLDYVKVEFGRTMVGSMNEKELDFDGNVHCYYDQTNSWTDVPNERSIRNAGSGGVILDCEKLELDQWTPQHAKPVTEMTATGAAKMRGSQFDASAERISYKDSTGIVIIEAPTRGNAELSFQKTTEGQKGRLIAKKIKYKPADNTYEVEEFKQADYSQNDRSK